MGSSSEKDATVFDFGEEEELTEATSQQLLAKFQPKNHDHPIDKYTFLQHFTSDSDIKQTTVESIMCIDIPEADGGARSYASGLTEENITDSIRRTQLNGIFGISACYDEHDHLTSVGMGVNMDSDGEEDNWNSQSEPSSSPCSDAPDKDEYMDDPSSENFHSVHSDMNEEEGEVSICPDYITYGATLYMEPRLTFAAVGIKMETTGSAYDEEISMEWGISDIKYINCKWTGSIEGVFMEILLQADPTSYSGKEGDVKVSCFLSDIYWQEKEHMIRNLASRYEEIWNCVPMNDSDDYGNMESALYFPKYYFSEIATFEDVIYPKGDPDAVSISKRDVDLLLPETFVNDTIIDFYIKYLSNRIPDNRKQRLHFFNSFFFRKLADLDKDPGKTAEGRAAFLRVRKWTRKFNIFDKDFIFIPVNFNLHWSLLVICHPGEIVNLRDDHVMESPKVPCILHMDSLKGSHSGLKDIIQSYLWEEWKERHPDLTEDDSSKFLNLRFVSLELPQQENSFDCGLFLLNYVERFLDDAPSEVNPFMIAKFSSFLTPEWFPPSEASFKRSVIRNLIYSLLRETSHKAGTVATTSANGHSQISDIELEKETCVELLSQPCHPTERVVSPVCPVDTSVSVCQVSGSRNGDDDGHELGEGENVQKNVVEGVSHCQEDSCDATHMVEPETSILVDDEEEEPSTVPNEEEKPDENYCSGPSPNHVCSKSPVICNLATTNSVLGTDGLLEESSKMDDIMNNPASPLPSQFDYVPDTPIEITGKDDGENGKKPIGEQVRDTPKTPIEPSLDQLQSECCEYVPETPNISAAEVSSNKTIEISDKDDGEKVKKQIAEQIRDTPKTPIESSFDQLQSACCEYVPETPSISAPEVLSSMNCEKVEKLSETDCCGYVPESPILSQEQLGDKEADGTVTEQVGMQIDETKKEVLDGEEETNDIETQQVDMQIDEATKDVLIGDKERPASTIVDLGKTDAKSASVSSGEVVISDKDEESVDKNLDKEPRKKRRRVAVPPEGPRRVTRRSVRGSTS